jgi:hypothetical protein
VNTTVAGTYTLTYSVTDNGGLSATTTRQVVVNPTTATPRGAITFCTLFADTNNVLATSSIGLPFGSFSLKLASSTNIANSTLQTKTLTASTFAPNKKIISGVNDADCVTYSNLDLSTYYYSELSVSGSQWIVSSTSPKYNDQLTQSVNNIFDLFPYSGELFTATTTDDVSRNVNADGQITLTADRRDVTLVTLATYAKTAPQCMIPEITSSLSAGATVGQAFSYTLSATSTNATTITYSVATSSMPTGLSFATSTNSISGTPTAPGTFTVNMTAQNECGLQTKTLTITIVPATPPGGGGGSCASNCGGGGGGGNGPVNPSLVISNEKVVEITPGVALVTWTTNLPATKEVGYGRQSVGPAFITAPFGYATSTVRISTPLETTHSYTIPIVSGQTYYFRPVSNDTRTTVSGIELVLNPSTGNGGGTTPNSCYYLFDYLKQGWDNNPVEVKKLQVFLRDLEGYNVEVNGIYDNQTVVALNAFQMRYKDDVLTPWGHTAPTSFTYITTKKKVNEIYCKMAFPVTVQQQAEIDAFRAFLQGLTNAGVTITNPRQEQLNNPVIIDTTEVGVIPLLPTVGTSTQVTLAGVSTTTSFAGRLTANVISSGKVLGGYILALITWPWKMMHALFSDDTNECTLYSVWTNWFSWILIIIIITMTYLWYRERRENKKTLQLNEEIDLVK